MYKQSKILRPSFGMGSICLRLNYDSLSGRKPEGMPYAYRRHTKRITIKKTIVKK